MNETLTIVLLTWALSTLSLAIGIYLGRKSLEKWFPRGRALPAEESKPTVIERIVEKVRPRRVAEIPEPTHRRRPGRMPPPPREEQEEVLV